MQNRISIFGWFSDTEDHPGVFIFGWFKQPAATGIIRFLALAGIATRAIKLTAKTIRDVIIPGSVKKSVSVKGTVRKSQVTGSILDVEDKRLYDREQ